MRHLACIMDGNRRYAVQQGWKQLLGHKQGVETANMVVEFCLQQQIPYLSLYLFSLENFKRTAEEKSYLFNLLLERAKIQLDELIEKNICVRFVGDRALFPESVRQTCAQIEQATAGGTALQLQLLFCYGGQQEIVAAAQELARQVADGRLQPEAIDEQRFVQAMWTGKIPEPDLIIRTGGAMRVSNFLLYQAAYSQYYFTDTLWPALQQEEIESAVADFAACRRNFGV